MGKNSSKNYFSTKTTYVGIYNEPTKDKIQIKTITFPVIKSSLSL